MGGKKILLPYLNEQLNLALTNQIARKPDLPRLTILGIGNELNGDDAAGVLIVRKLKQKLPQQDKIQLIEGSIAPENYSSVIRKFNPEWIWLIDAVDFDADPGHVQIIDTHSIETISSDTHRLPIDLLFRILKIDCQPEILLLGIQPSGIEPFTNPSMTVRKSIQKTTRFLLHWIKNTYNIKS